MSLPSIAVPLAHNLECLNLRIDVLNDNPLSRQLTIKQLLLYRQWMILALFVRNATVRMQRQ